MLFALSALILFDDRMGMWPVKESTATTMPKGLLLGTSLTLSSVRKIDQVNIKIECLLA